MLSKTKLAEIIGSNLKKAREKKGISQEELAHSAGLYRTYVGHMEVGRYVPSAFTLYKVAKALDIRSADLLPF